MSAIYELHTAEAVNSMISLIPCHLDLVDREDITRQERMQDFHSFVRTLYHAHFEYAVQSQDKARNSGYVHFLELDQKHQMIQAQSQSYAKIENITKCINPFVEYPDGDNLYVSVNTFSGHRRKASKCYAINAIVVDLDDHRSKPFIVRQKIENTFSVLYQAIDAERIPVPTIINATGRGLQLLFVYDRSISYRTQRHKRNSMVRMHRKIVDRLYSELQSMLDVDCLRLDESCRDLSRVVRIPGTINTKTDTVVRTILNTGHYVNFDTLAQEYIFDHEPVWVKSDKKTKRRRKKKCNSSVRMALEGAVNKKYAGMFAHRAAVLDQLVTAAQDAKATTGFRHNLVFHAANLELQRTENIQKATAMADSVNQRLSEPLSHAHLDAIMRSFNGDTEHGYKYCSNTFVAEMKGIADVIKYELTEVKTSGLTKRQRTAKRKQNAKKKRMARAYELAQDPNRNITGIARELGVKSRTTIYNWLKSGAAKSAYEELTAEQQAEPVEPAPIQEPPQTENIKPFLICKNLSVEEAVESLFEDMDIEPKRWKKSRYSVTNKHCSISDTLIHCVRVVQVDGSPTQYNQAQHSYANSASDSHTQQEHCLDNQVQCSDVSMSSSSRLLQLIRKSDDTFVGRHFPTTLDFKVSSMSTNTADSTNTTERQGRLIALTSRSPQYLLDAAARNRLARREAMRLRKAEELRAKQGTVADEPAYRPRLRLDSWYYKAMTDCEAIDYFECGSMRCRVAETLSAFYGFEQLSPDEFEVMLRTPLASTFSEHKLWLIQKAVLEKTKRFTYTMNLSMWNLMTESEQAFYRRTRKIWCAAADAFFNRLCAQCGWDVCTNTLYFRHLCTDFERYKDNPDAFFALLPQITPYNDNDRELYNQALYTIKSCALQPTNASCENTSISS